MGRDPRAQEEHPAACERKVPTPGPPTSPTINYLARLRKETQSEEGSADAGVPPEGSGWSGHGAPTVVGVGYTTCEVCDGKSPASPGPWLVAPRRYPSERVLEVCGEIVLFKTRTL